MMKYLVGAVAALASTAAFAADNGYTGARVEARLGYETPTVSGGGEIFKLGSAVSYGAEAGYDFNVGKNVTFGPYGSFEKSSVKECDGADCIRVDHNYQLGGRVGAVFGNLLGYAKLGYSNLKLSAEFEGLSDSDSKGGIGGGIGLEVNAGKSAYWGIEANYSDFGDIEGTNLQRRQVAAKLGLRF